MPPLALIRRIPLPALAAIVPALIPLAIAGYQLAQPDALLGLHGSDDGVWLAPGLQLVHGAMPYRDYVWVHPPGIALLMAPFGFIGDSRWALVAARVVSAIVVGLNVSLAALAVRHRGPTAMLIAAVALAVFPHAVVITHTMSLEPYLVMFCLLGAITMFRNGSLASRRRLLLAGAFFGLATVVKLWGILPAVAALAVCLPRWRSAFIPFGAGFALGFGLPTLPFFIAAPESFMRDVVLSQVVRSLTGQGFTSLGERLAALLGFTPPFDATTILLASVCAGTLALVVVSTYAIAARRTARADWFLFGAAAIAIGLLLFVVKEVYTYYTYFVASLGILLLATRLSYASDGIRHVAEHFHGALKRIAILIASAGIPAASVVVGALVLFGDVGYARTLVAGAYDPAPTVQSQVPADACASTEVAGLLIDSNRYPPRKPGCPVIVDAFGTWLTDNSGVPPPAQAQSQAFVAKWQTWLEQADYLVLSVQQSDYVPWTPDLTAWFNANYGLVASQTHVYVYKHLATAEGLVAQGLKAQVAGDLTTAASDYRQAIQVDPRNTLAHYDLGTVFDQQRDTAAAVREYETTVSIDPNFAAALFNLGVDTASSDPHGAEALYRRVVSLKPAWASAWLNLGFVLQAEGRPADAMAAWAKAIALDPSLVPRIPSPSPG